MPIFENMPSVTPEMQTHQTILFPSAILGRDLTLDFYLPAGEPVVLMDVLLINDGQDLLTMNFDSILENINTAQGIRPLLCIGIHAGPLRRFEYGTAVSADYKRRGGLARRYADCIVNELVPAMHRLFPGRLNNRWAFAGFSLGALSALDICWNYGNIFNTAGIFSGSLWWRNVDKDDPNYQDEQHRIMHNQIRNGWFVPGMKFFFECGTADETADRNGNGIIDSIDDTKDLISELKMKGYNESLDIYYHEIEGGRHDVATWAAAMPLFLHWAFNKNLYR